MTQPLRPTVSPPQISAHPRLMTAWLISLLTLGLFVSPATATPSPDAGLLGRALPSMAEHIARATAQAQKQNAERAQALFFLGDTLRPAGESLRTFYEQAWLRGLALPPWSAVDEASAHTHLEALVAALPAQPREEPLLKGEDGYYLPPEAGFPTTQPTPDPEALARVLDAASRDRLVPALEALEPSYAPYQSLVAAAFRYHGICESGGWDALKVPRGRYGRRPSYPADALAAVQRRLALEGYEGGGVDQIAPADQGADVDAEGIQWSDELAQAITDFRRDRHLATRHPLLDADFIAAANIPCAERLDTIVRNIRRWRHSALGGDTTYVFVNIPAQSLAFVRDGEIDFEAKVVVGSDRGFFSKTLERRVFHNATPIMRDAISVIVLNPDWVVPSRIARNEIDKIIERDPDYLETNHFRVVEKNNGPPQYIQKPGPKNALGTVKILFPNAEAIYLHDTPGKGAFRRPVRALSHGCVRVERALDFAFSLIERDKEASGLPFYRAYYQRLMKERAEESLSIRLQDHIPVLLEYYTASVVDGRVAFHPDLYRYDVQEPDKD